MSDRSARAPPRVRSACAVSVGGQAWGHAMAEGETAAPPAEAEPSAAEKVAEPVEQASNGADAGGADGSAAPVAENAKAVADSGNEGGGDADAGVTPAAEGAAEADREGEGADALAAAWPDVEYDEDKVRTLQ